MLLYPTQQTNLLRFPRKKRVTAFYLDTLYNYSAVELDLVNPPSPSTEPTCRGRMGSTLTTYCYSTDNGAPVAQLIE